MASIFEDCDQYLASTCDRIKSLNIAQNNDSSETLQKMLGKELPLSRFVGLKSLTLSYLSPRDLMDIVNPDLSSLSELIYLKLECCRLTEGEWGDESEALPLINSIWSLPKLKYCIFKGTYVYQCAYGVFVEPTVISPSLIYLSTHDIDAKTYDLTQISRCTPNLKYFSAHFSCNCPSNLLKTPAISITNFELTLVGTKMSGFEETLKCLPNLHRLIVRETPYFDGYKWESIITQYLPALKQLEFSTTLSHDTNVSIEEQVDSIIKTFRTPFWLEQHQWFVTCESNLKFERINIFTVPFNLKTFHIFGDSRWKSTYPTNKQIEMDAAVRSLEFFALANEEYGPLNMQLRNVEVLTVGFPLHDTFSSIVVDLDSLKTINIKSYDSSEESKIQLKYLVASSPNLSHLCLLTRMYNYSKLESEHVLRNFPFDLECPTIKVEGLGFGEPLNEERCEQFCQSTLASHCNDLHITVKNRKSISDIVRTMNHLPVLYVNCEEIKRTLFTSEDYDRTVAKKELIEWLKQELLGKREFIEIFDFCETKFGSDGVMLKMSPIK